MTDVSRTSASTLSHLGAQAKSMEFLSQDRETLAGQLLKSEREEDRQRGRDMLVTSHLRFVMSLAREKAGYGIPLDDLIQEGNIGLLKATQKFDYTHGVRFSSFAKHYILAQINEYIIRNEKLVKTATTKAHRKLFFNLRSMYKKLKDAEGWQSRRLSTKQLNQIATELDVHVHEVKEMETRLFGEVMSLDAPLFEDSDSTAFDSYLMADTYEPTTRLEEYELEHKLSHGLAEALTQLNERQQKIIHERWLIDTPKTLAELSAELGISGERVRQLEVAAMKKMRKVLS